MPYSYTDLLRERVVVFDGATGTNLQLRNLSADDFGGAKLEGCNENLVITRPDVIRDLHSSFLDVGVDVIETNTFGAFSVVLDEYGLSDEVKEINSQAVSLAREVANQYTDKPRFVAGSVGPGTKMPTLGHITFVDLRNSYEEQMTALLEAGVDLLVLETCYDLLQAKAAMQAARRAMSRVGRQVPIQTQITIETTGRMLLGTEIAAAFLALDAMKPDTIGLNCATGPREMSEHLRYLSQHSSIPISVLPNAGLPSIFDGKTHYDLTPTELAEYQKRFIETMGVRVVGGCCGTTPEHLRAVVDSCINLEPAQIILQPEPGASSNYNAATFHQEASMLIIGERTNANGSREFRDAMLEGDYDACERVAREQVRDGAHVLDVCVDYVGRDGADDMSEIAKRFATAATAPIVLDSTEPKVLEAGLQWLGGRCILNSANLEDGDAEGSRLDRVFRLAQEYGAAVICLLIDEDGQARDVEWKLRVAHRIFKIATEKYGLKPEDLLFDALTFPISTGEDSLRGDGIATIEAIRRIKLELPGVFTVLGVSNVSFGLSPVSRQVLNSVFLHECHEAGMDAAIVHASKIKPLAAIDPEHVKIALDLVYDRRAEGYDPLEAFIEAFLDVTEEKVAKVDLSSLPIDERLAQRIIDGDRNGLEADLDEALLARPAIEIINNVLLAGMKTVGDRFGRGEMQLPFVLKSAECMKSAVSYLEPHMTKADEGGKGTIVLATVKGDVHDIGKNLVDIILSNNGYNVYNLGIKIALNEMLEKAIEVGADAIGMSGLLVKSTIIMRENLEELNLQGRSDLPVLLGGAALTRRYVERDLRQTYEGAVFYGKDAFEGLQVMDDLMEQKRSGQVDPSFGREVMAERVKMTTPEQEPAVPAVKSDVPNDNALFVPPFVGSQIVKGLGLDEIVDYINETALFRNQWGFRPENGENDSQFKERIRPIFREQLDKSRSNDVLIPQVAYGYFPANSDGNDLVVYSDVKRSDEVMRFTFPRQKIAPFLCITDFFRPVESGEIDYACFTIATMGERVSEETAALFAGDNYQDYLFLHGLAVEMTEALAEYWHARIRAEWGFGNEDSGSVTALFRQEFRGGRYSWGYPACPDLEDNAKVVELLESTRIGVTVTDEFQLNPEQTTSAIVCHHPQAKYFIA